MHHPLFIHYHLLHQFTGHGNPNCYNGSTSHSNREHSDSLSRNWWCLENREGGWPLRWETTIFYTVPLLGLSISFWNSVLLFYSRILPCYCYYSHANLDLLLWPSGKCLAPQWWKSGNGHVWDEYWPLFPFPSPLSLSAVWVLTCCPRECHTHLMQPQKSRGHAERSNTGKRVASEMGVCSSTDLSLLFNLPSVLPGQSGLNCLCLCLLTQVCRVHSPTRGQYSCMHISPDPHYTLTGPLPVQPASQQAMATLPSPLISIKTNWQRYHVLRRLT